MTAKELIAELQRFEGDAVVVAELQEGEVVNVREVSDVGLRVRPSMGPHPKLYFHVLEPKEPPQVTTANRGRQLGTYAQLLDGMTANARAAKSIKSSKGFEHRRLALYELDRDKPCAFIDWEGTVRVLPSEEAFDGHGSPSILFAFVGVPMLLSCGLLVAPIEAASPATGGDSR